MRRPEMAKIRLARRTSKVQYPINSEANFTRQTITNMSDTQPPKKRGCFFYGCITCVVLFLVLAIGGSLVVWYTVHTVNGLVLEYTDTVPMPLPKVDMPADELARLKARVAAFSHALDAHTNTPPLVLTSRELNALMTNDADVKRMGLNDAFYVDLEGDHIKGQVSLPLDQFPKLPLVHTAGRYLNGTADFAAEVTNSALSLTIMAMEAKGKPLPPKFMAGLQQKNLADDINRNPTNTAAMSRFDSIEIKDSTLIIKAKTN